MKRVLALSMAALAATLVVAAIATADRFQTKKVTIKHPTAETFTGKVKAKGGCNIDRTVKVTKVDEYGGKGDPVGTAQTDETGAWTMTLQSAAAAGGYKAVAKKTSVEDDDGVLHKCKKGTSRVLNF